MMKKSLFTLLLMISSVSVSNAQFLKPGIAFTLVTPTGNFSDLVGTGYGGVVMGKFAMPVFDITGSVEYLSFSEKETGNIKFSSTMWSINAGARVGLLPFISAGAELGNYWITVTAKNGNGESDNTETKIAFTPLIAIQISILEGSIRYSVIKDASFISFRAGIYF